jgi:hypothetical protein
MCITYKRACLLANTHIIGAWRMRHNLSQRKFLCAAAVNEWIPFTLVSFFNLSSETLISEQFWCMFPCFWVYLTALPPDEMLHHRLGERNWITNQEIQIYKRKRWWPISRYPNTCLEGLKNAMKCSRYPVFGPRIEPRISKKEDVLTATRYAGIW